MATFLITNLRRKNVNLKTINIIAIPNYIIYPKLKLILFSKRFTKKVKKVKTSVKFNLIMQFMTKNELGQFYVSMCLCVHLLAKNV